MTSLHSGDARLVRMTPHECWQQLNGADQIARVVWSGPDGPAIAPVNYAVSDGAVWFQVSSHSALGGECEGQRILVEVDQADPATHEGWSVIVTGTAEGIPTEKVPDILRGLQVWPNGPRNLCVRVDPEKVTGRRLMPRR
jgi:hypothetical protein